MSDRVFVPRRQFLEGPPSRPARPRWPRRIWFRAPCWARTAPCPPASRSSWAASASAAAAPTSSAVSCSSPTCGSWPAATCGPIAARASSRRSRPSTATHDCPPIATSASCWPGRDIDAVLITTGSNWHALLSIYAAKAGKDVYCEKPCTKTIAESLALAETFRRTGPRVPGRHAAAQPAPLRVRRRAGPAAANSASSRRSTPIPAEWAPATSGWPPAQPEPAKDVVDWDMFLGAAAWRPFNRGLLNSGFEKGGGMVGGGCLEWGSHCIDLCQWANSADDTAPVEYFPVENGQATPAMPTA